MTPWQIPSGKTGPRTAAEILDKLKKHEIPSCGFL